MVWLWLLVVVALSTAVVLLAWRVRTTDDRTARMESRLAAVLEGFDTGLSVWDREGRLVACTERFREYYPTVQLKPGLAFEDLIRYTATRGLVQIEEDLVETWVDDRVSQFGGRWHDVVRTSDGRWVAIDTRPTRGEEVILSYADTTQFRNDDATLSDRNDRLEQHANDLNLLTAAVEVGSRAVSPETATAEVVKLVCTWAAWPVGYAYRVVSRDDAVTFDSMPAWHTSAGAAESYADLHDMIARCPSSGEDGIATRAIRAGGIVWVPNIAVDPSIESDIRAAMPGIRGACAVPVVRDGQAVSVLVFLSRDQLAPVPATTRLLEAISETLGWVHRRSLQQLILPPTGQSDWYKITLKMAEHIETAVRGRPPSGASQGPRGDEGPPDLLEHGAPVRGEPQTLNTRLFVQLQVFTGCLDIAPVIDAVRSRGMTGAVYANVNDPRGVGIVVMDQNPALFVEAFRSLLIAPPFDQLTPMPDFTMIGRTYAQGREPDLQDFLLHKVPRNVLNPDYPWAVWYPLRRIGAYNRLPRADQGKIMMEHGMLGRRYGEAGYAVDVRLECHGIDRDDNEFVIGLIGPELYPLSKLVKDMRSTRQTAEFIQGMGPFFVGKAVYQAPVPETARLAHGG